MLERQKVMVALFPDPIFSNVTGEVQSIVLIYDVAIYLK